MEGDEMSEDESPELQPDYEISNKVISFDSFRVVNGIKSRTLNRNPDSPTKEAFTVHSDLANYNASPSDQPTLPKAQSCKHLLGAVEFSEFK